MVAVRSVQSNAAAALSALIYLMLTFNLNCTRLSKLDTGLQPGHALDKYYLSHAQHYPAWREPIDVAAI